MAGVLSALSSCVRSTLGLDEDGAPAPLRERPSLATLVEAYEAGDREPIDRLMRAFRAVQELPHEDPRSYFQIAGIHGAPFRYRTEVDRLREREAKGGDEQDSNDKKDKYRYWPGYCHHGNVLFPTWHRAFLLHFEDALRHFEPDVAIPYWDETCEGTLAHGLPRVLTDRHYTFVGDEEPSRNPLYSYVMPVDVEDLMTGIADRWRGPPEEDPMHTYRKPAGYETVRYPLSGLVGTPGDRAKSENHNREFPDDAANARLLKENLVAFFVLGREVSSRNAEPSCDELLLAPGTWSKYLRSLSAPNYTAFSNTTSAAAWRAAHGEEDGQSWVTSLEGPHNDVHLAIGGFDLRQYYPGHEEADHPAGVIEGSNGDFGENNTSAFDPVFWFHHAFVDRLFWLWQLRHGATRELHVIEGHAGTNNTGDGQGPTPGTKMGEALTLDTPLRPFRRPDGEWTTSRDVVDIRALGYCYAPGSLEDADADDAERLTALARGGHGGEGRGVVTLEKIDRADQRGSFMVLLRAVDGDAAERLVGFESVLSRNDVSDCDNCQRHRTARIDFAVARDAAARTLQAHIVAHAGDGCIKKEAQSVAFE